MLYTIPLHDIVLSEEFVFILSDYLFLHQHREEDCDDVLRGALETTLESVHRKHYTDVTKAGQIFAELFEHFFKVQFSNQNYYKPNPNLSIVTPYP